MARLQAGMTAYDDNGVSYTYGFEANGEIERLEFGNTMNQHPIVYSFSTGAKPASTSMMHVTDLRYIKIICKNINTTGILNLYHYGDHNITPTHLWSVRPFKTGVDIFRKGISQALKFAFHRFRLVISTTDAPIGFEPISISLLPKFDRYDTGRNEE
jgi:hypothetical protein